MARICSVEKPAPTATRVGAHANCGMSASGFCASSAKEFRHSGVGLPSKLEAVAIAAEASKAKAVVGRKVYALIARALNKIPRSPVPLLRGVGGRDNIFAFY